jgi:hypothetical protein
MDVRDWLLNSSVFDLNTVPTTPATIKLSSPSVQFPTRQLLYNTSSSLPLLFSRVTRGQLLVAGNAPVTARPPTGRVPAS